MILKCIKNADGRNHTEFGQILTMQDKKSETMFCAKDVAMRWDIAMDAMQCESM